MAEFGDPQAVVDALSKRRWSLPNSAVRQFRAMPMLPGGVPAPEQPAEDWIGRAVPRVQEPAFFSPNFFAKDTVDPETLLRLLDPSKNYGTSMKTLDPDDFMRMRTGIMSTQLPGQET